MAGGCRGGTGVVDGTWRSPVAHLNGVQGVAGSNPAVPIVYSVRSIETREAPNQHGWVPLSCVSRLPGRAFVTVLAVRWRAWTLLLLHTRAVCTIGASGAHGSERTDVAMGAFLTQRSDSAGGT